MKVGRLIFFRLSVTLGNTHKIMQNTVVAKLGEGGLNKVKIESINSNYL